MLTTISKITYTDKTTLNFILDTCKQIVKKNGSYWIKHYYAETWMIEIGINWPETHEHTKI